MENRGEFKPRPENTLIRKSREITASVRKVIASAATVPGEKPENYDKAPALLTDQGKKFWADSDKKAAEMLTKIQRMNLATDPESRRIIGYFLVEELTLAKIKAKKSKAYKPTIKYRDAGVLVNHTDQELNRILARLFANVNQRNEAKESARNAAVMLIALDTKNPNIEAPALQFDENIRRLDELIQTTPYLDLRTYRADPEPAAN